MVQENEVIMLLLYIGVLIFIQANRSRLLDQIPSNRTLLAGFYFLVVSSFLTVLEGLLWGDELNLLEHGCYAASAILIAVWCWQVFVQGPKEDKPR